MKLYLQIAWRNLWRNKKRTIITISSVVFAVILATFTRSLQIGAYDRMIDNATNQYTGQIQVHSKKYKDVESIDNSFEFKKDLETVLNTEENVWGYAPRLESFTLISTGKKTKGAMLVGIDPEKEIKFNKINEKIVSGRFLRKNDSGILIAEGLANKLDITINDTIIFYSQGMYGMTAAAKYNVIGILKYPLPAQNDLMTFLPLKEAQYFYSAPNMLSSVSIRVNSHDNIQTVKSNIQNEVDASYLVEDWQELLPDLVQMIEMDSASGLLIIGILYGVIGFGLFGTAMMIALERKRELSTLFSIGMKRKKLVFMVSLETVILSLTGFLIGVLCAEPIIYYFNIYPIEFSGEMAEMMISYGFEPVMPTSTDISIIFAQGSIVLFLALFTCSYPTVMISKLRTLTTLRD